LPVSFELVLTEDLPNGPYGEISAMSGKLYVPPGSTYDEVAGALIAAWIKSRGDMMNMNVKGIGGMGTSYTEDWRVVNIEYKGGNVDQAAQAAAGMHNSKLGITQKTAPPSACCVIN
jgi:hypothetical protein